MDRNSSYTKTLSFDGKEPSVSEPDAGQSILILVAFFVVISSLFGLGMGFSFICYRRALKKRKDRERREARLRLERERQLQFPAVSARPKRGVPNWYSPNPKDEISHLLDVSIVPVQVQAQRQT